MGTVYKAVQKSMNREVALKVLEPGFGPNSEEAVKRFELEVQAMKKLDHQNLVHVFGFGNSGRQYYIAMTYVPGTTVSSILNQRKKLTLDEAVLIVQQVARGLLYAHSKGITHRDIKPSNILVTPENRVYVTDFGISHIQDQDRLTNTGTAMGTPEYMSPEQCQGAEVTHQSDIYSLGIIFYEMLTGHPPFEGSKPLEIAYKQVHSQPEGLGRDCQNPLIESLILRCLRKNRSDRIKGAAEFLEELDKATQPINTGDDSSKGATLKQSIKVAPILSRKDNPRWLLPAAFGVIALLTLLQVLLVLLQRETTGIHSIQEFEVSAPWEKRALETDAPNGYPLENLYDGNLQSAWLLPVTDLSQHPVLSIRFKQPTLITHIGIAVGYQKTLDDQLQDRFAMFQKPLSVIVKTVEGSVQKINLENIRGVQYPEISAMETMELRIEFRSTVPGAQAQSDMAISELRLFGIEIEQR